jgi:hypothetical protein
LQFLNNLRLLLKLRFSSLRHMWPYSIFTPILALFFFLLPNIFKLFVFPILTFRFFIYIVFLYLLFPRDTIIEWFLFNAKWAIFQLYHDTTRTRYINEMIILSTLYLTNKLSWIFIVLAHWNNCPQVVDTSLHFDTLSWFQAKQPLLLLLNAVWLTEMQKIIL